MVLSWIKWVAKRYLKSKRDSRFLSLSTGLATGGIALGVAAIIIVLSVMKGFENQLREKLIATDLHVLMTPKAEFPTFHMGYIQKSELDKLPVIAYMKTSPDVDLYAPILSTEVVLRSGTKVSGVLVKGVDAPKMERVRRALVEQALPQMLVDRDGPDAMRYPGVFVGRELAYEMGLIPGDFVTLISPSVMDGPFSNIPRMKRFIVEGIYKMGAPDQESHIVYMEVANMESYLREKGVISSVEVSLKDASDSNSWSSKYRKELKDVPVKIQDWNELNANLFASMRLERIAMFLILMFTVIVASLNIVSTLMLIVQEKLQEIAILRTVGARSKHVLSIFMYKGFLMGTLGVGWGTGVGIVVCVILRKFNFINLPDVYYDRTIPVSFDPLYFFGVPLASFAIVLIASFFPAQRAAGLQPIQGVREEFY
ncbi:MAG: ABC transporter permease [Bdellovibrionales bacterium]|nr:ABC transporter permease [Bdellovibrionales bacterium]